MLEDTLAHLPDLKKINYLTKLDESIQVPRHHSCTQLFNVFIIILFLLPFAYIQTNTQKYLKVKFYEMNREKPTLKLLAILSYPVVGQEH